MFDVMGPQEVVVWAVPSVCGLLLACACPALCANSCTAANDVPEISLNGTLWNIDSGLASIRLDVDRPNHLGPLLGVVGDELAEVGRRTLKYRYAQGGKSRLDLGISEGGIDFLVELVDDLGRRILGNADTMPAAGLVVRHKFAQGWNVR